MNELIRDLLKLQSLEFDEVVESETEKQIAELRARVSPPILAHYDRLLARGKKGLAAIRNQVCTACHMHVTRSTVQALMHNVDIQVCENCGRYIYLEAPATAEHPETGRSEKTSAKRNGRKALLHAA